MLNSLFIRTLPVAQAITTITTDDTFGGIPAFAVKLFWLFMLLDIIAFIMSVSFALYRSHRDQEVPVMVLVTAVLTLLVPVATFTLGRMVGLGPALDYFSK